MSHLVETMAYAGQKPWHGLGHELPAGQPIEVWADRAGMNWTIEETPVRYITGASADGMVDIGEFPDQQVLYRSDNHQPLSVVSKRFKVVQPREILEFYRDLTEDAGFELETAGVLKGGRKLWALAKTGQSALLKGGDAVKGYLLLATACDGTLATTAQFTSVRVVCNNTLTVALGKKANQAMRSEEDAGSIVKVPHSTEFNPDVVKAQLGLTVSNWDRFISQMKRLSNRPVSPQEAEDYFAKVLNCSPKAGEFGDSASNIEHIGAIALPTAVGNSAPAAALRNERAFKRVQDLYAGAAMGANLDAAKGTAWGLLNAVTEFVDHHRRARSQDNRLDSAWFGQGAILKQTALEEAVALLD